MEALELCRELEPDLVLMDVRMPKMDGLEATRAIKDEFPTTSILMVTSNESPEYLLDAIRAGAAGYVLKDAARDELVDAVRRVARHAPPSH
jgi:DNA-binding NarL/FixJ family response regulator